MKRILANMKIGESIILTCFLLFLHTSVVGAAEDITGEWDIKHNHSGLEMFATLYIVRKADGTFSGKWGHSELADVQFKKGILTFTRVRKTRVRDFRDEYTLTFEDEKLTGTMSTPYGNYRIEGIRKKLMCPALGQWDLKFIAGEREITGRLTISEKPDGTLVGKWDADFGEHLVSNVKFQKNGKLTYTRKSKLGEREWESTFEGMIEGHTLLGNFKSQQGELLVTGERVGAALVGKWELTNKYSGGSNTNMMEIAGDLTGRYESAGGNEVPIQGLNLEGNQVTFFAEVEADTSDLKMRTGTGDMTMRVDFKGILYGNKLIKGKLTGKTVMGKYSFDKFTNEIIGKLVAKETQKEDVPPKESVSLENANKIVFVSDRDGNYEIYVMNVDGSGMKRLTNNNHDNLFPSWSPDGRKIAFESRKDNNPEIYVMNADGSGQANLTNNSSWNKVPSWSPDGKKIAFHSLKDEIFEIYVMNPDGSKQERLTNNRSHDMCPFWSPDGKKIAFTSNRDGERNFEIYVMNADGSKQERLTNNPAPDVYPSWSPDGTSIAFASIQDRKSDIYVMNTDGSGLKRLTNNSASNGNPSWSPDGTKIVFTSNIDGNREIYIMNADGNEQKRLTNNPAEDRFPCWSPKKN